MPANSISFGNWKSYSPSWTSTGTTPAIGNGVKTGWYLLLSDLLIYQIMVSMGSTTTYGTGDWLFGLPTPWLGAAHVGASWQPGQALGLDNGTAWHTGRVHTFQGVGYVKIAPLNTGTPWTNNSPHTWANTDGLNMSGYMKIAT